GQPQPMEPYHVIMQLPEGEGEEFILILPFTPETKNNMIAWMAARSDGDQYGEMLLYEFPKRELVYGPSQIEARVDQNPNISPQLTLWDQEGSRVIRGDLLVIPIEQSLLYVEPIYLQAETEGLPELKRVIVAYGDQVVMEETLEGALVRIFGERQAVVEAEEADESVGTGNPEELGDADRPSLPTASARTATEGASADLTELAKSLSDAYEQAQEALQRGDWDTYGQKQRELEGLIEQFNQQVGN
ncbi:MAG: COG1615 family transporter, partial [Merismopedia sp. SIO2A8]|nr:COG1615 family transporter [Merismopedia sp. SIO2A8]